MASAAADAAIRAVVIVACIQAIQPVEAEECIGAAGAIATIGAIATHLDIMRRRQRDRAFAGICAAVKRTDAAIHQNIVCRLEKQRTRPIPTDGIEYSDIAEAVGWCTFGGDFYVRSAVHCGRQARYLDIRIIARWRERITAHSEIICIGNHNVARIQQPAPLGAVRSRCIHRTINIQVTAGGFNHTTITTIHATGSQNRATKIGEAG